MNDECMRVSGQEPLTQTRGLRNEWGSESQASFPGRKRGGRERRMSGD